MPVGVTVTTDVMQPSGSLDTATAAQMFLSGLCERGDTAAPIVARNMTELQALTGGRVTYGAIYDAAQAYFGEGGSRVVVARKVGAAATKGAVTLPDRAGSPVSTLTMTAQSAGAWSSNVTVTVADGLLANTV